MRETDNAPTRAGGYHRLGHIGGAEIGVRHSLRGQSILIQEGKAGWHLARLLGVAVPEVILLAGEPFLQIPHTDRVDELLKQIVEALIAIRYAHPTLVQLHLDLPALAPSGGAAGGAERPEPGS